MKSLWVWIVGIVIAILIFSGEKEGNTSVPTSYSQEPRPPVYQQAPIPASSPTFMGYRCTVDCSGHEAGYEWAGENGIDDPNDCDGNSDSFIEGCQAYAEEHQAAMGETTDEE